ncbi:MAG: hypothetical protein LBH25_08990 [Fibromonadaceae bacterium]|jgi:hypothetical protein|nr:hypothetical protein [Fibromonadaceae bacterium]
MNASTITTRVADLIRNPSSAMPSEWERSVKNKKPETQTADTSAKNEPVNLPSPPTAGKNTSVKINNEGDTLTLSPLAARILEESDSKGPSEWERARNEKVQRVQQLVKDNQYTLSPEMADDIAQKIVAMLRPNSGA